MIAKPFLDQGLPRSAAETLRRAGIDAIHTGDVGLATADDSLNHLSPAFATAYGLT